MAFHWHPVDTHTHCPQGAVASSSIIRIVMNQNCHDLMLAAATILYNAMENCTCEFQILVALLYSRKEIQLLWWLEWSASKAMRNNLAVFLGVACNVVPGICQSY